MGVQNTKILGRRGLVGITILLMLLAAACAEGSDGSADAEGDGAEAEPEEAEAEPDEEQAAAGEDTDAGGDDGGEFPSDSVRIIVPFGAGGAVDVSARLFAGRLEEDFGVPVTVENIPGAGTQVATTALVSGETDGHTILATSFPSMQLTYLDEATGAIYDRSDLRPVMGYVALAGGLAVQADSEWQTVDDFIAAAQDERVTVGTGGLLTAGHLPLVELELDADVELDYVHFDGGAEVATNLLGGHIDAGYSAAPVFRSQMEAGDLKMLSLFDTQRSDFIPDVPTLEEQGYEADGSLRYAFILPSGVPDGVPEAWETALTEVFEDSDFQDELREANMEPLHMDSEELGELWDRIESVYPELIDIVRESE